MKKIIIQGLLWDEKSSFLKGPSEAPPKIREILHNGSSNYFGENGIAVDTENIIDNGNYKINEYWDIYEIAKSNLKEKSNLLTLGGDHSITYPIVRALNEAKGSFHILHFDAHTDLYDSFGGDKFSHACPFARICEEGLCSSLTQVGIRTLNPHQRDQAKKYGVRVIEMKNFDSRMELSFDGPVYISLDIDAFDPAYAPGVSHHEPGGLASRDIMKMIQRIKSPIIGADIVEYNPSRDIHDMTAALCAKMMKELLSMMQ